MSVMISCMQFNAGLKQLKKENKEWGFLFDGYG